LPSALYQTKPPDIQPPDEVWARHWAHCDIDREIEMCGKREIVAPMLSILRTLKDPRVVDCGCGAGIWIQYFQQQGIKNITGIDSFAPALRQLEKRGGHAIEGDILRLPFDKESVDVCLSFGVVEHFPENPTACLREMERILAPGGYLFLTVPYYSWVRRLIAHPVRWAYIRLKRVPLQFFEYRFRDWEIINFCSESGFEVLSCTTDDFLPDNMSMGLWLDIPFLRSGKMGELSRMGVVFCKLLRRLNPWLISAGILIIARKPKSN
jgi:SAM-dependent methyltransferase